MPTVISCPSCQRAIEYMEDELGGCKVCGEPLPDAVLEVVRRTLRRARPIFLMLIMVLYAFVAAVGTLILAFSVLGSGPYTVNGEAVTKAEFLRSVLPLLVPLVLAGASVAYALWKEKVWGRHLLLAVAALALLGPAVLPLALGQAPEGMLDLLITSLPFIGFLAWYLYRKQAVVNYFAELKAEQAGRGGGSAGAPRTG